MLTSTRGLSPKSLRVHNIALLLRLIAQSPMVSRAQLADRTGLTKATVSSLVSELVEASLVDDLGPDSATHPGALRRPGSRRPPSATTQAGRPAGRLVLNQYGPAAVGLQLAGDHVAGCLMD